ncbi:hypothetical protein THAOC_08102, partial [Thalassiosira oceanica]
FEGEDFRGFHWVNDWEGNERSTTGDTIGMLLEDLDEGTLTVYKNNRRLGVMENRLRLRRRACAADRADVGVGPPPEAVQDGRREDAVAAERLAVQLQREEEDSDHLGPPRTGGVSSCREPVSRGVSVVSGSALQKLVVKGSASHKRRRRGPRRMADDGNSTKRLEDLR